VRRLYSLMYTSLSLKMVCLQKPIRQMRMTYRIASPLAKDSQFCTCDWIKLQNYKHFCSMKRVMHDSEQGLDIVVTLILRSIYVQTNIVLKQKVSRLGFEPCPPRIYTRCSNH
jgi:hypothetical protein